MQQRYASSKYRVHREAQSPGTAGGVIETLAGSSPFQVGTKAANAGFGSYPGMAMDAAGNLYVSTYELRSVLKVDRSGNVTMYAGQAALAGPTGASGDGGPANLATLVSPEGLALDSAGNLYIADPGSSTVREVAGGTGVISTIAGMAGKPGAPTSGQLATAVSLGAPTSLAFDENGTLFIGDAAFVESVDPGSGVLTIVAGYKHVPGPVQDFCLFFGASTGSCPALSVLLGVGPQPNSIAVAQGTLYIAGHAAEFLEPAVLAVQLNASTISIVAGGPVAPGGGSAAIGSPLQALGVAVDSAGNLDILDGLTNTVRQLAVGAAQLTTIAGNGSYGYSGDGGAAVKATLALPEGIVATAAGTLLLADGGHLRSISPDGTITTVAGNGTADDFGDNSAAQTASLDNPLDAVTDTQGNVYIADSGDNLVRRIDAATGTITTIAGTGLSEMGTPGSNTLPGDGGLATRAPLNSPQGLALDNANHLYIGQASLGIRVVNLATGSISTLNSNLVMQGTLAFDGQHTLYAVDQWQVVAVDTATGAAVPIAGSDDLSQIGGDGQAALQTYLIPTGVALDGQGNLYISDRETNTVRIVNLGTGIIQTFAGTPLNNSGYPSNVGYSGDGGPAIAGELHYPTGLHFDSAGHLLIADSSNHAIRQVDLSTGIITTIAGNGVPGFGGDGQTASSGQVMLDLPEAAAADPAGNLLIADSSNERIRRIVLHPTALQAALTASPTTVTAGSSVTFTATFQGISFGFAPTGSVTFYDGTTSIGAGVLSASGATPGSYSASLTNTTLAVGPHSITAQYGGDANYASGTTPAVPIAVAAVIPPSFNIQAAPSTLTISQGGTGTVTFTLTPAGGFNQAVTFACGTGLPKGVSCSFSPAGVTPNGTASVTSTLTVSTTGMTVMASAGRPPQAAPGIKWWLTNGAMSLGCLLIMGLPTARRRAARTWLTVSICVLTTCFIGGCGSASTPAINPNATPVGVYTVTVIASSGATAVSQPATLKLTITN